MYIITEGLKYAVEFNKWFMVLLTNQKIRQSRPQFQMEIQYEIINTWICSLQSIEGNQNEGGKYSLSKDYSKNYGLYRLVY